MLFAVSRVRRTGNILRTMLGIISTLVVSTTVFAADGVGSRVVNGQNVPEDKFRNVGVLSGSRFCTLTLISPTHVLTAAHCVEGETPATVRVRIGVHLREVANIFVHPGYGGGAYDFDAAILELTQPITGIAPARLISAPLTLPMPVTIVGFGNHGGAGGNAAAEDLNSPGPGPGEVTQGNNIYDGTNGTHYTYNYSGINESSSGHGDSGGPNFVEINGVSHLAGITSYGSQVTADPGTTSFDQRVDLIYSWIIEIIGIVDPEEPVIESVSAADVPVTGVGTTLNVVASDPNDLPSQLVYTWTNLFGPDEVILDAAVNGTSAASSIAVTFQAAGGYTFEIAVLDTAGNTVTSTLVIVVQSTLVFAELVPGNVTTIVGRDVVLLVGGRDQFEDSASSQFVSKWSVSGGGQINDRGIFSAATAGGPYTITATLASGKQVTGSILVIPNVVPAILSLPTVTPNPVTTAGNANFSIGVSDDDNENLSIVWDFGDGSLAVGANTTHTFTTPGTYDVKVKVFDGVDSVTTSLAVQVFDAAGQVIVKKIGAVSRNGVSSMTVIFGITPGLTGGFDPSQNEITLSVAGLSTTFKNFDSQGGSLRARKGYRQFSAKLTGIVGLGDALGVSELVTDSRQGKRGLSIPIDVPISVTVGSSNYSGKIGASIRPSAQGFSMK